MAIALILYKLVLLEKRVSLVLGLAFQVTRKRITQSRLTTL
jgi:hypothetical protein